jgi:hypothetical protein
MVSELLPAFSRPLKLLLFSPVCAASSVIISSTAGTTNLIFASLGRTFQEQYGFSASASGLVYLAVTVGFVVAAFLFGTTSEYTSQLLVNRNHGKREPEFRLPGAFLGPPLIAVGLCWYGWTVQDYIFWAFPVLGLNVVGMGITLVQVNSSVSKRKHLEYANNADSFLCRHMWWTLSLDPRPRPLLRQRLFALSEVPLCHLLAQCYIRDWALGLETAYWHSSI